MHDRHSPSLVSFVSFASFAAMGALAMSLPAQLPWFYAPVEVAGLTGEFWLQGDLDLDGDVDAISFQLWGATAAKTSFTVWSNNGTGGFTAGAATPLPAMTGVYTLLADLDGDGRRDLVLSNSPVPSIMTLLIFAGQAGGTFGPAQTYTLPAIPQRIQVGNGNADNCADLLWTHSGAAPWLPETRWLFGGPGFALTLGPSAVLPLSSMPGVVDVDGDGRDDVAVPVDSGPGPDVLEFHLTTPTGFQFASSVPLPFADIGHHLTSLDHDGDGDRDLADHSLTVGAGLALARLTNLGSGNWASGSTQTFGPLPDGSGLGTGYAADWDGDGRDDLLIRSRVPQPSPPAPLVPRSLILFRSEILGFTHRFTLTMGGYAVGPGAGPADLNLDGHPDFLDSTVVYFGDGVGTSPFRPLANSQLLDWDRDGDADVTSPTVSIHNGNLGFTPAGVVYPALPPNHVYGQELLTDLDGDGRHEVLVAVFEFVSLAAVFRGTHLLREGTDFQFAFVGLAAGPTDHVYNGVVVDTDGDGDMDIVNQQGLWLNNGTPFFTLLGPITTGYRPVAAADVDNDGDPDLLATTTGNGLSLAVLYRTAPNTFTTTVLFPPSGGGGYNLVPPPFVDIDDDGDLDVVARDNNTPSQAVRTVLFTNQNGVFTSSLSLPHEGSAMVGDVDGDGLTDLVFADATRTHVLRRVGPGLVYALPVSFMTDLPARELIDLDQDGDLDVAGESFVIENRRFNGPDAGHRQQYGNGSLGAGARRPVLSVRGPIREGLTPSISLRNAPGGTFALLVLGSGPDNTPSVVLPGVQSYVAPIDLLLGFTLGGALGQPGAGAIDIPVALPLGLGGVHAFVEFVVLDLTVPFAFTNSNGCELAIGQ